MTPKRMDFRIRSKGRVGVIFNPKIYIADCGHLYRALKGAFQKKKLHYDFPKMRGVGGQRPFGIFPKIHPFWYRHPSLRKYMDLF